MSLDYVSNQEIIQAARRNLPQDVWDYLTKDGRAVPSVDDIATPALDLWAQENGYRKIELNLAGV